MKQDMDMERKKYVEDRDRERSERIREILDSKPGHLLRFGTVYLLLVFLAAAALCLIFCKGLV